MPLDPEVAALDPVLSGLASQESAPADSQSQASTESPAAAPQPVTYAGLDPRVAALDPVLGGSAYEAPPKVMTPDMVTDKTNAGALNGFARKFKLGTGAISQSVAGWKLATANDFTTEQARQQVETDDMVKMQKEEDDYATSHMMIRLANMQVTPEDLAGGWVASQVPMLGVAAVGGVMGAAGGAVFGAPAAGLAIGAALTFGVMGAGNTMYALSQRGVDRDQARVASLASGIAQAVVGLIGPAAAVEGATGAATAVFKDDLLRASGHLVKSMGIQIGAAQLTSLTDSVLKYITAKTSQGAQPYSVQDALTDFTQSGIQALVVAPEIAGGMHIMGSTAGHIARNLQLEIDAKTEQLNIKHAAEQAKQQEELDAVTRTWAARTEENIQTGLGKATKQLRGFAEVNTSPDIEEAQQTLTEAKAKLQDADDPVSAQLEFEHAQAQLKMAQHKAHIEKIEEALTNPNYGEEAKQRLAEIDAQITQHKEEILAAVKNELDADNPENAQHWQEESERLRGEVSNLQKAGAGLREQVNLSGDELKDQLSAMKASVENKVDHIRLKLAESAVKSRINDRAESIEQLRAEIRAMKKDAKESDGEAMTAELRAKLEQMKDDQAVDELVRDLYASRTINPQDSDLIGSKVPVKRLKGLVDIAKRQIDKAGRAGQETQLKTSLTIRKWLNAVIDSTRLDRDDKNALKTRLTRSMTLSQLAEELPRLQETIEKLFDKRRHEAALADLEKVLDGIKPTKQQESKTPGTEEALLAIKQFANDHEAIRRLELNLEEKEIITPLDEQKLELSELFPDEVKNLSPEQIERIIKTVVELRETGKTEALKRYQAKQERQTKNLAYAWHAMTVSPQGKVISKEHIASTLTRVMEMNPLRANYRSWSGLMYLITQRGTLNDLRHIFDLKVANAKAWGINHEWRARFKQLVNEHGVTDKQYAKAFNRGEKKVKNLSFAELNIESDEIKKAFLKNPETGEDFNRWELVQIYNYLRDSDPDAISRLSQGNRFSYPGTVPKGLSTIEVIETNLSREAPELLRIADAQRQFYKEFSTVVDETVYRRWGRHIEMNDTYGGPLHSGSSFDALARESFRRMTVRPKSMLERSGGTHRVQIRNAMDVLDQHIASFAREHSFLEFEQDAQALFGDQQIRDFITRNYGKMTMKVLDKYIKDIINGPREVEDIVSRVVSFFRSKAFTYYLGGRPDQYIKQLTGAVHAFQVNSPKEVIEGWSYFFANPKESIALMNKSPLLRNRKQLLDPDFKPSKPGDLNNISQFFMKGVEAGDVAAVYLSSFPALLAELKKTGNEAKALAAFDRAFEETQGSHGIDEQTHLFRSGTLMKMLTIFTQQANRQAEMNSVMWDKFVNDKTPKRFLEWANTVGVSYAGATLYPLAGWIVLAPFMENDKAEKRLEEILAAAPLGPYASLPLWGLVLTPMMTGLVNTTFDTDLQVQQPKTLETDILADFLKNGEALLKAGSGDTNDVWNAIIASSHVFGRITGVPLPNLLKLVSPFVASK